MSVYKATLNSHGMKQQPSLGYERASHLMDTARFRDKGKPLENNTRLFDRGDHFAVRLHNTDVVRIYPDGWSLHTEGYGSATTKDRLNKYAPVHVWQRDFVWYVQDGWKNEEPRYFIDGLFIDKSWKVWDCRARYHYHLEHQAQAENTDETEAVE